MKLKKLSPNRVGLLQALSAVVYCSLVAGFFILMDKFGPQPKQPEITMMILMLFLLVFSVAVTGLLVFGYPTFLMLHKETKRAMQILAYTFLYSLLILILIIVIIIV